MAHQSQPVDYRSRSRDENVAEARRRKIVRGKDNRLTDTQLADILTVYDNNKAQKMAVSSAAPAPMVSNVLHPRSTSQLPPDTNLRRHQHLHQPRTHENTVFRPFCAVWRSLYAWHHWS